MKGEAKALRDLTDGTSNTLLVSEVRQGPIVNDLRGLIWYGYHTGFTTFNPPNTSNNDELSSGFCQSSPNMGMPCAGMTTSFVFASRSRHTGGVQSLLGDGSVRFISENINLATWRNLSTMQDGTPLGEF